MGKLGVAVIGCGPWGKNHIRIYRELEQASLIGASDKCSPELLGDLGIKVTKDYKQILRNEAVEALSICTPASTHFQVAMDCLNAGKHVLCEKPLSLTSHEAGLLVKKADEKEACLMVGHTFRFDGAVRWIREKIRAGYFGEIFYVSLQRMGPGRPREDCGALHNYAPHDFDIFSFILNEDYPNEITGIIEKGLGREYEDFALISARYGGDTLAYSQVSWLSPKKMRDFWVVGEKKSAFVDTENSRVILYNSFIDKNKLLPVAESQKVVKIDSKEPLKQELAHFLECVETGKPSISSGEIGVKSIRMIEAALKSAELKKTMRLKGNGEYV